MIPWAIDDLIISDDVLWQSALKDAHGLPQSPAQLAERFGRWPVFGGLARPGRRLSLVTLWNHATHALRAAAKLAFEQYASPEREVVRRLMAVDSVVQGAASSGLLALGPWDVARSSNTYAPRDLLDSDTIGTVSGGVIWGVGRFGKAIQIAEATTNYFSNPRAYTDTTGWSTYTDGTLTLTRDTTQTPPIGTTVLKVVTGTGTDWRIYEAIAGTNLNEALTISLYVRKSDGSAITSANCWPIANGRYYADGTYTSVGNGWYRVSKSVSAADLNTGQGVRFPVAGTFYFTMCQCEKKAYRTPFCDGSLGPGHSWSGTAHASTSARTIALCTFPLAGNLSATAGTVMGWVYVAPTSNSSALTIAFSASITSPDRNDFYFGVNRTTGKWSVGNFSNGAATLETADTITATTGWHHIVWAYGGSSQAWYVDGVLIASGAWVPWTTNPTTIQIGTYNSTYLWNNFIDSFVVVGQALTTAQVAALYTAQTAADWKARWCNVIAEEVKAFAIAGEETDQGVVSTLAVDGDVRWRSRDGASFWRVIAATGSVVVNNDGDDDAYPVIYLTPKAAKSGDSWAYKRWIVVKWLAPVAATSYPVDICNDGFDTATLTTAKMQADGDDLRVWVDGVEVNRWLDGMDTATTKVFCNLNFQASQTATLAALSDSATTITSTTDITNWPSTGILYVDTEAITYTGKSTANKQFTGCTRGAKGTAAAAHAAAATAYWIQHDIWILYGNAAAAAPTVDDNYKPAFELDHSTNTSWVYEVYGETDGLRTASWSVATGWGGGQGFCYSYTDNHMANATPWPDIGIRSGAGALGQFGDGLWYIGNVCGITNANFTNGEYHGDAGVLTVESSLDGVSWSVENTPALTLDNTWRAWSDNEALIAGSKYVGFRVYMSGNSTELDGECADCTLTLNSTYTPVAVIGAEQSNYDLAVTLTNATTGDSLQLALTMQLNQTLEINTDAKTITLLADNSRQMQALTLTGGARRDWLRLAAGPAGNTLTWSDTGTVSVEVEILFDRRYFE